MMGGITGRGIRGALPVPVEERFWNKVSWLDDEGEELQGCWEWTGFYSHLNGQPQMNTRNARVEGLPRKSSTMAYRVAWVLINGPVPDGQMPYRACANKRCVREDHLRLRTRRGPRTLFPGKIRRRVMKLTEANAAEIRRIINASRGRSGRADYGIYGRVGKKFGIAKETIYDVVSGKTWRDAKEGESVTNRTTDSAKGEEYQAWRQECVERNAKIYEAWRDGCRVSALALIYKVSRARISQIIQKETRRRFGRDREPV